MILVETSLKTMTEFVSITKYNGQHSTWHIIGPHYVVVEWMNELMSGWVIAYRS